ncbi:hypothetical protein [Priestia megaterium]|uniref:hypothetical protein n=1 Tax=Priestia megaterium TaxID=1404 RepID=UPI0013C2D354|nr:hypothetical protein [Priestia megaterium]
MRSIQSKNEQIGYMSRTAYPAGIFALPSSQQLEAAKYMKPAFALTIKKSERS